MEKKTGMDVFLEYAPMFSVWYKVLAIYLSQIILFILILVFFWWISSLVLYGAIIGQIIISLCGTYPYVYMANHIEKIREKYLKKYDKLACQKFWINYQSYTIPFLSASMYCPILLKSDYLFFQGIVKLPTHFITADLFPEFIAIPLGISIIIFGFLIRKPSGGFDADIDTYLYLIYPEKGRLLVKGLYKYIRNPRYLSQGFISIGFGVVANNLLAIFLGIIHFLAFYNLLLAEDKELIRRFGDDFKEYQNRVPALFPKFGNWSKFIKLLFDPKR